MTESKDILKNWAAAKCGVPVENINYVFDSIYAGTCGYGTCDYREITIDITYKSSKNRTKNESFTFDSLADALADILKTGAIRLGD